MNSLIRNLWSGYRRVCLLLIVLTTIAVLVNPWFLLLALVLLLWLLIREYVNGEYNQNYKQTGHNLVGTQVETFANQPLTGTALLARVEELGDVSKSDLVRACGYVSTKDDGGERLNFTAFYEALLDAKGVGTIRDEPSQGDEELSFLVSVQDDGILIEKDYTALLDLKPGDEFEIKLGRKQIRLVPNPFNQCEEEEDEHEEVDIHQASQTDLPSEWLHLEDEEVLEKLKPEEDVAAEILEVLAKASNWRIRVAVALHESTADHVLKQLADDDDSDVKEAIQQRLLPVNWRKLDEDEKLEKLKEEDVAAEILEVLAKANSQRIRKAVGDNRNISLKILGMMNKDKLINSNQTWRFVLRNWGKSDWHEEKL